jgi:hypothetical protein
MNLQFEISDEEVTKLNELMQQTDIESYRELFNASLTLFKWAREQVALGKVIAAVDETEQKYTEIQMDALRNLTNETVNTQTNISS